MCLKSSNLQRLEWLKTWIGDSFFFRSSDLFDAQEFSGQCYAEAERMNNGRSPYHDPVHFIQEKTIIRHIEKIGFVDAYTEQNCPKFSGYGLSVHSKPLESP
ncbi:hypothetical protein TURU_132247 [Turdus rufiventris]|nr:hypothetical protein TURU_132247 [Turdus rufiventris]